MKDDQGEYKEAITLYEKSLEIYKKILPPNHCGFANCYTNVGIVYRKMGEHSKALSYFEKALAISQKTLPPNHPDLKMYRKNLDRIKKKL